MSQRYGYSCPHSGDKIKAGEVIAEIETDKAAVAFEYQDEVRSGMRIACLADDAGLSRQDPLPQGRHRHPRRRGTPPSLGD